MAEGAFRVIVAGTDGSTLAEAALAHAARIAAQDGAALHVVCAFPDASAFRERLRSSARTEDIDLRSVAEDTLARAKSHVSAQGVDAQTHLVEGDPAEELINQAHDLGADLLVVGSRGLSRVERIAMGSVSHKVFHHAPCTVMIVKG